MPSFATTTTPVDGHIYYIFGFNPNTSEKTYLTAVGNNTSVYSTTMKGEDTRSFLWQCVNNGDGTFSFKNLYRNKYLDSKALNDSPVAFTLTLSQVEGYASLVTYNSSSLGVCTVCKTRTDKNCVALDYYTNNTTGATAYNNCLTNGYNGDYYAAYGFEEYTTSDIVSAMPENGKVYFLYGDNQTADKSAATRIYHYVNGEGILTQTLTQPTGVNLQYLWMCEVTEGNYKFRNLSSNKYLKYHESVDASGTSFAVSTDGANVFGAVTLKSGSNYMVHQNTPAFAHATRIYNKYNEAYSTDYFFEECSFVPPLDGYYYYIYCDNYGAEGGNVANFLYDNSGAFGVASNPAATDLNNETYVWKCILNNDGSYNFQNKATPTRYLAFHQITESAFNWSLEPDNVLNPGRIALRGEASGAYPSVTTDETWGKKRLMLIKPNGTYSGGYALNKWTSNKDWSSDFMFLEYAEGATPFYKLTVKTEPNLNNTLTLNGEELNSEFVKYVQGTPTLTAGDVSGYEFNGFIDAQGYNRGTTFNDALTANTSLIASYSLNTIYPNYADQWFRILKADDLTKALAPDGTNTTYEDFDATKESQLWCLVGTEASFSLYNKSLGNGTAFTANTSDFAGWSFIPMTGNVFTLHLSTTGTPSVADSRVDKISIAFGTTTLTEIYNADDGEKTITYYLSNDETITVTPSSPLYRGVELTATDGSDNPTSTFSGLTVGSTLNFTYTLSSTEARYLGYNEDAYRIPAITTTKRGTLLAVYDKRPGRADVGRGEVDLVSRTSTDNGVTWSAQNIVLDGDGVTDNVTCGYGDAALIADRESDKVLLMCVASYGNKDFSGSTQEKHIHSFRYYGHENSDGVISWDENPTDMETVMYTTLFPHANAIFIGSGRIMQSRKVKVGSYYRLYCSVLTKTPKSSSNSEIVQCNFLIYSDDFGATWNVLGGTSDNYADEAAIPSSADEPKAEELPNGDVILSSRLAKGRTFNVFHFTDFENDKTTGTWGTAVQSTTAEGGISNTDSGTNGEIYSVRALDVANNQEVDLMLLSMPFGNNRANVGFYYKPLAATTYTTEEFASNWTKALQVSTVNSAYSTFAEQIDGRLAFFMEEAPMDGGAGYCMVYLPISIADITGGKYIDLVNPRSGYIASLGTSISEARSYEGNIGPGYGYYWYDGLNETDFWADVTTAETFYSNISNETSDVAIQNQVNTLRTYLNQIKLVTPFTGKFYRIKNTDATPKYAKSAGAGKTIAHSTGIGGAASIFFLDDSKHLISFADGAYTYDTSTLSSLQNTVNGQADIINFEAPFTPSAGLHPFNIRVQNSTSSGKYWYSDTDNINKWRTEPPVNCNFLVEDVTEIPVTIGSTGYATLYTPVPLTIPDNLDVFRGEVDAVNGVLQLTVVENTIPANQAVIIRGTSGTYPLEIIESDATFTSNDLTGSNTAIAWASGIYTMQKDSSTGEVGFYGNSPTNGYIPGFKAFIQTNAPVKGLTFDFTTAISEMIINSGKDVIYDLSGRKIQKPSKGIYIINNQKYFIK